MANKTNIEFFSDPKTIDLFSPEDLRMARIFFYFLQRTLPDTELSLHRKTCSAVIPQGILLRLLEPPKHSGQELPIIIASRLHEGTPSTNTFFESEVVFCPLYDHNTGRCNLSAQCNPVKNIHPPGYLKP